MNFRNNFLAFFLFTLAARATEQGYFEKFYKPGPLQQSLVAQTTKSSKPQTTDTSKSTGELNLDNPELGPPPASTDASISAGPFSNLVFGGTLDYRFIFPKDMPEGMFMIHVNELFLTTNIGDNISILAEQLLLTNELGTVVGQDHGFVYATISNLDFLPTGTAIRIGRLRLKYGIDAKLDGPANPLRTPEYRTIGLLSDRAIEAAGYFDFLEYTVAVSMGADYILKDVTAQDGSTGTMKVDANNRTHPLAARVGTDFKGSSPNVGLSYYTGMNYKVLSQDGFQAGEGMIFGGFIDQRFLVSKERESVDVRWGISKFKFAGEYTFGSDSDPYGRRRVEAYYFRTDYNFVPQKWVAQIQYDSFYDGSIESPRFGSIGLGLTYYFTDQSWIRAFYQAKENIFKSSDGASVAGTQLLLAF